MKKSNRLFRYIYTAVILIVWIALAGVTVHKDWRELKKKDFERWEKDSQKTKDLIRTIEGIETHHCLGGHWTLLTKEELLTALREDTI